MVYSSAFDLNFANNTRFLRRFLRTLFLMMIFQILRNYTLSLQQIGVLSYEESPKFYVNTKT